MKKILTVLFSLVLFSLLAFSLPQSVFAETKTQSFWAEGKSSSISLNDPLCGYTTVGCIIKLSGKGESDLTEKFIFDADAQVAWQNSVSNGKDGYCAPATSTIVLKEKKNNDNTLSLSFTGTGCDVAETNPYGHHSLSGTFTINSGTGIYQDANGSGKLTGSDNGKLKFKFRAEGEITYQKKDHVPNKRNHSDNQDRKTCR